MSEDQFMGNLYQRFPVTVERGVGAHVWDIDGKEYIDCMGGYGVALVGHQNKRVNDAIKNQIDKIITVHSSLYNKTREEFLKTLIGLAPKKLTQVHLNNSGAEAIEAAMKFARKFTGKKGMIAMKGSYHGKSFGSLSLTFNPKYRKAFAPLVEKVSFASYGDIESLRSVIDEDTAFVILEPIQGESGIIVAPDGFLQEVRKLCDEKGILLIFDEIQAGLGRTGRLWACDHWNTAPDILCLAKGIAGGVPMGATLVRPDILAAINKGEHSSTFGGNPISCAAGTAALKALTEDGLIENSEKMGKKFKEGLEELKEKHTMIREIRGKGLMIGIEMKFEVRDILMGLIKKGVLMLYSGRNILRILPPLVISEEDVTKVLHALDSILTEEEQKRNAQG
ncbi:MAG TPA: acetylornithine/succinylornithine family transaminase [Nitrosopumilus sp.]|jgi:acetylornithine/LysW-gamma-L-lysine aminotransferase|nr:aspartate aminotransferase family protein [Nitrososphaerota archaeon]MDP6327026.1 acetylornithine/succinylornithine family transaminase [Nitrosopumilus sp.]HJL67073.1 acetylornithine/succinylornithine family transaminase [Nitrosopumilus sp.]HJM25123.1 acetylornithine/succinylornithine family transaminase [Nitrosopumilus sp.]HJO31759.1 acetylornithine/succinylornithine family transaminase [Nitrosopumilus sp.]|tara:strand:+ start:13411 stop:14592 length:1182 start_codon:yes stop_codon:yes gene_type:complete